MPNEIPTEDVYMMFCGAIDQLSAQRIMNGVNLATQQKQRVHLLFQSTGGIIGDGVCLHNYLTESPTEVVLYNVGTISSVAVVAYLGANTRIAHEYATFMIHSPTAPAVAMNLANLAAAGDSLKIDEGRIESILKSHINITPENWSKLRYHEHWFTAQDAVTSGIATKIGHFSPPAGQPIYTL